MIDSSLERRPERPMAACRRLFGLGLMVELSDEIDMAVRDELQRAFVPLIDSPIAIVDLTNVTFCDTTLLNAVIELVKKRVLAGNDLPVRIAGASPRIRRIFALTRVDRLVCIYGSMSSGLTATRSGSEYRRAGEVMLAMAMA